MCGTRLRWAAMLLVGVALLGAVTAAPATAAAPEVTFVESTIETDTTWTPEDGPYRVIRSVEIEPGATLTIEPGTDVQLAEGVTLTVSGSLRAGGTAARPVTIGRTAGAEPDRRWESIRYNGTDNSRLALRNTTLRGGTTGIAAASGAGEVRLTDSTLRDFTAAGVGVTDATPTAPKIALVESTIRDVTGHAIDVTPSNGVTERVELTASNPTRTETTRNTLALDPGAGVSTDTLRLRYPAGSSVQNVSADTLDRIGLDEDRDGDVDRSLSEAVTGVTVDGRQVDISLSRTVRISSRDRLLVEYGGVVNPRTRGVYPVDVSLLDGGVPQLSDGARAAYVVGEDTVPAASQSTASTRVSGLTVAGSTIR
ncbi:right-handed parallel beta-helix repeat-containing protein, partial [Halorubrum pallidum]